MKRKLLMLALLGWGAAARAQQASPSASPDAAIPRPKPPTGVLLQSAPNFSSWEINFATIESLERDKPSTAAAKLDDKATRVQQVATTKTGKIIHEVATYTDRRQVDKWYDGAFQYEKRAAGPDWGMKMGTTTNGKYDDASYEPFPASGFRDLGWVGASTYAGTIPFGDRSCLVFVQSGADKLDLRDPSKQKKLLDAQTVVAYVDSENRLPVALRTGTTLRTYRFTASPTEMQVLPAALTTELKKGEDARTRLLQMAPRPY